jgi:hypothetical protein
LAATIGGGDFGYLYCTCHNFEKKDDTITINIDAGGITLGGRSAIMIGVNGVGVLKKEEYLASPSRFQNFESIKRINT